MIFKGPDAYMNNLLAVALGFRFGREASVCDVIKMHWCVQLFEEDQHMQRMFWHNLDQTKKAMVYLMTRNNMGVCSAN